MDLAEREIRLRTEAKIDKTLRFGRDSFIVMELTMKPRNSILVDGTNHTLRGFYDETQGFEEVQGRLDQGLEGFC